MLRLVLLASTCIGAIGCGTRPANPPPPAFGVAAGDAPVVIGPEDDPPGERLRKPVADGPAIKSFRELLAGLPKDKHPLPGAEGIIERNEAKAWLAQNALDRAIEFTLDVRGVDIQDLGEGRYSLDPLIRVDPKSEETRKMGDGITMDTVKFGNVPCAIIVRCPSPMWTDLDATAAKRYRDLKNKKVVLQGIIDEAEFQDADRENELVFRVLVIDPVPVEDIAKGKAADRP